MDARRANRTFLTALALIWALLIDFHLIGQAIRIYTGRDMLYGLIPLFDAKLEGNVPAFFSTFILLVSAFLLWRISNEEKNSGSRWYSRWNVLAWGFFYLAIDEASKIHELLIRPGQELLGEHAMGIFYFAWVIPGIAVIVGLGIYFFSFLFALPDRTRRGFIAGGFIYVLGALGTEMLDGWYAANWGFNDYGYAALVALEEGLEMLGIIIFIASLLGYIAKRTGLSGTEFARTN